MFVWFTGHYHANAKAFRLGNTQKVVFLAVKSRAANEYSSLGVRGDLGLYSSPF